MELRMFYKGKYNLYHLTHLAPGKLTGFDFTLDSWFRWLLLKSNQVLATWKQVFVHLVIDFH